MEAMQKNEPNSKIPIIFGLINSYQIHNLLEQHNAKTKESKAVFLIRDSSTYPGLITVSYYCQEQDIVKHIRFGLTEKGWKTAPKPPQEPLKADSTEIKEKYALDKIKFDKKMKKFINTAKKLFEQHHTAEPFKTLILELQKHEFNLEGLIKPQRSQASQEKHFTGYV
ncbi:hypothetical protein Lsai_0502 [Legionella sainthelensi]|uniref:SH2 domain-containing protein n=1 Tax=Legionella sainthelensi TaxID=28087 RepID=A0A0W0YSI7_9GAMM|nr:SH2 domain-containing protein [Legionella sainthelensi]KTD59858.1 hypothetical protein Lsai_0502 [Legionella sainthelensi]VEH31207.1 Uncharacterised protein [Legionella sainthelensi]